MPETTATDTVQTDTVPTDTVPTADDRELVFERLIPAPRAAVWRAWTDPAMLARWFCPAPWTVTRAELDVRPGGRTLVVMRSPEGQEFPNAGVYLEVVPERRLVFTDAYVDAWVPSERPFMTATITLADEAGGTRYVARVRHWTAEARAQHEQMGFHTGWGLCADQLTALVGAG